MRRPPKTVCKESEEGSRSYVFSCVFLSAILFVDINFKDCLEKMLLLIEVKMLRGIILARSAALLYNNLCFD